MRHGNVNRKFGRKTDERRALLRSLARSLALEGRITTTEARAKELRGSLEKLITRAKSDTVTTRRTLRARRGDEKAVGKLIAAATLHKDRQGGYLRIVKLAPRKGDAAKMAVIEFV